MRDIKLAIKLEIFRSLDQRVDAVLVQSVCFERGVLDNMEAFTPVILRL